MTGEESKKTNLNQLPAGIKKLIDFNIGIDGGVNLDYGAGKYIKATKFLSTHNITNLPYDPYNLNKVNNHLTLINCMQRGGADSATMLNVLNVIPTQKERIDAISRMLIHIKPGAKAIIGIYEKTGNGEMEKTTKGWQLNQHLSFYKEEIKKNFPKINIIKKDKYLIITR